MAGEMSAAAVCSTVLTTVQQALVACESGPLNLAYVAAGIVAWDDCCGMLVVAPERIYRTAVFPTEGPDENQCYDGSIALDLLVLLMRCVPVVDDRGNPPAEAEMAAAYLTVLEDAAIVWNALATKLPADWVWTNEGQQFAGAEGGCIGIETRITVGIDAEQWCLDCPPAP